MLGMVYWLFLESPFFHPLPKYISDPGPTVAILVLRMTGFCNLAPAPLISSNLLDFCHLFCRDVV